MKLRTGDTVIIIAGKDRGKTGTIDSVLPKVNRVVVGGQNSYKKHVKPSPKNPQGGIVTAYRSMHASNVMLIDSETKKPTRIGFQGVGKDKVRISRLTKKPVGK